MKAVFLYMESGHHRGVTVKDHSLQGLYGGWGLRKRPSLDRPLGVGPSIRTRKDMDDLRLTLILRGRSRNLTWLQSRPWRPTYQAEQAYLGAYSCCLW